ncbi:MAG: hypothetical protein Q9187_004946 [Circinaria calcarea]
MDPLQSFTFLTASLPDWITRIDKLSAQIAQRHSEFRRLSQGSRLVKSSRKKKTSSTESLRREPEDTLGSDNDHTTHPTTPSSPNHIEIDPSNKHLFQEVREARRRCRPTSIPSGASGPRRYRTRTSLVIYYDSAIQEEFGVLVRNIGSARNNIRKGKANATFKTRMASMGREHGPSELPKLLKNRDASLLVKSPDFEPFEPFELVDRDLEAAQSFCEVGAHQFLREGNCREEVQGVKERFESCLKVAEQQVAKLEIDRQKETEQKKQNEREGEAKQERRRLELQDLAAEIAVEEDPTAETDKVVEVDIAAIKVDEKLSSYNFPGIGAIEVDDESDGSSVHIDLSAFRSARRALNYG